MSILKKLLTAARGAATEAGEEIVDANALRILDQEIRDATTELGKSKIALSEIMAKRKVADNAAQKLRDDMAKYETYASTALDSDDEALAIECAEKVAFLEEELEPQDQLITQFTISEENLKRAVKQADHNLSRMRQQVAAVKATEQVQKAQAATASRFSGSNASLSAATDSLARIKARQEETAAKLQASQELSDLSSTTDLDAKLKAAGIGGSAGGAGSVLDRIRAKKAKKGKK